MATVTMTQFVDDLDDEPIEPDSVRTVTWTWMGVAYELDVSEANLTRLENGDVAVSTLLERSRRVGGRRRLSLKAAGAASSPRASTPRASTRTRRDELNEIRDWARNNGHEVSERGRVSREITAAYEQAHK